MKTKNLRKLKYYSYELRVTKTSMRSSLSSKCDLAKINLNLMHLKIQMTSSRVDDLMYNSDIDPWMLPQLLL